MSQNTPIALLPENPNILLLGGTCEARLLADWLSCLPAHVISSLAGRTKNPHLPKGGWRSGGFGGVDGLVDFLHANKIHLILDATHPFAQKISDNARQAARKTSIPLLNFERPPWQQLPQDHWIEVEDETQAAARLPKGAHVFLALGRQHLAPFAVRQDIHFIARMIEAIPRTTWPNFEIIQVKPQDDVAEQHFLKQQQIDMIVSRNSGGHASYGKIAAARALGLPVMMIRRPVVQGKATLTSLQQVQEKLLRYLFGDQQEKLFMIHRERM